MTEKCATLQCPVTEGLEPVEGAVGLVCAACRAELFLLVEQIRKDAVKQAEELERRRIE